MKPHKMLWTAVAMLLFAASLSLGGTDAASAQSPATNVAVDGVASQSSTGHDGLASRAIDDNTEGRYGADSVTHTHPDDDAPWFQLGLAESTDVERIVLWNRTDSCCEDRLSDFTVFVSPTPFVGGATRSELEASTIWSHTHHGEVGEVLTIDVDAVGSYIGHYKDTAVISLAEIQVFGTPASPSDPEPPADPAPPAPPEPPADPAPPAGAREPFAPRAPIGDVNCYGELIITDAVVLAQYTSGQRTNAACEGIDQLSQIHLASADTNFDGFVDIGDALFIAHCSVGLVTLLCPDIGGFQQTSAGSLPTVADNLSGVAANDRGDLVAVVNGNDDVLQLTGSAGSWNSTVVQDPGNLVGGTDVEGVAWITDDLYAVATEGVARSGGISASAIRIVGIDDGTLIAASDLIVFDDIPRTQENQGLEGIAFARAESSVTKWVFYAVKEEPATLYRIEYDVDDGTAEITDSAALPGLGDAAGIAIPEQPAGRLFILSERDRAVLQFDGADAGLGQMTESSDTLDLGSMAQPEGITTRGSELVVVGERNEVAVFDFASAS